MPDYLSAALKKKEKKNINQLPTCSQKQENIYQVLAQKFLFLFLSICSPKSITETIHKIHNPQEKQFKPTSVDQY